MSDSQSCLKISKSIINLRDTTHIKADICTPLFVRGESLWFTTLPFNVCDVTVVCPSESLILSIAKTNPKSIIGGYRI